MVLLAIMLAAGAASAQGDSDVDRARFHFMAGRAYYDDARYPDAAREFEEAYRLTEHPDVLYNLGLTYERMGRARDAIDHYRRYLEAVPEAPEAAQIYDRIRRLEAAAPPESAAGGTPASGGSGGGAGGRSGGGAPAEEPSGGSLTLTAGWVLVGVGAATAAAAVITGVLALGTHADLEGACPDGRCPADRADDIESGETLSIVSTVLTGVAIGAGGAGLLLLLTSGGDGEGAEVGLVPGGAFARVRF